MINLSQAQWRKATRSTGANTGCVEIAAAVSDMVAIRDSTSPERGAHVLSRRAFRAFLDEVKAGRFDL